MTEGSRPDTAGPPYPAIVGYHPSSHPPGAWGLAAEATAGCRSHKEEARRGHARTSAAASDCLCTPARRLRARQRWRSALSLERAAGAVRSQPGAAVERNPAGIFLAERDGATWRKLTYAAARPLVDALATALIERGLSAERPVMILSANSIDHALLTLAGHTAGV